MSSKSYTIKFMKKDDLIAARITEEMKAIIQKLADDDDRPLAWMVRKLLTEALESRGIIKKGKGMQK